MSFIHNHFCSGLIYKLILAQDRVSPNYRSLFPELTRVYPHALIVTVSCVSVAFFCVLVGCDCLLDRISPN